MDALVILGATAVGKSKVAVTVAQRLGGEIVSVDSRQAYRHLDIGTAKPTKEQRESIPHHMIDILELDETNNAERYARMATLAIDTIRSGGALPILVGGSGLYFRAIFKGFFAIDLDQDERRRFADSVAGIPTRELRQRLESADPRAARRIHPNDRYRTVRALEVFTLSGVTLSEHFERQRRTQHGLESKMQICKVGLTLEREDLSARIRERTASMIRAGLVDEVRSLLDGGADPGWPGMQTLGYPEVVSFVRGRIDETEMNERIVRLTRRYAKRQMTWFRKERGVTWLRADGGGIVQHIIRLATGKAGGT
ncbi:MAG: tRNA (adenosine(37)-N6)-dimethylallyltransferase MiaA [bacterium]|nr:MAG: tRNA (adenosine(37)-N6)-dimethylallyltransferase MiaA [bacterium]